MPKAVDGYLLDTAPHVGEFIDRGALTGLIDDYRAGRSQEHVHLLISLLMLEIWLATYLPRATGPSSDTRERILVPG